MKLTLRILAGVAVIVTAALALISLHLFEKLEIEKGRSQTAAARAARHRPKESLTTSDAAESEEQTKSNSDETEIS